MSLDPVAVQYAQQVATFSARLAVDTGWQNGGDVFLCYAQAKKLNDLIKVFLLDNYGVTVN